MSNLKRVNYKVSYHGYYLMEWSFNTGGGRNIWEGWNVCGPRGELKFFRS